MVVSSAAVDPDIEQPTLRIAQSFVSVPGQKISSVRALDPRADPEWCMRALSAAGNGSFVHAAHGATMLASLLTAILGD